ncbi:MAG TPA: YqaA family protein [Pseudomonadales bacterium]|nr:YqaA family protein [Pseudomonadales bacterium]
MLTSLLGLFFSALVAATLFPAASEAVLVGLLLESNIAPFVLISTASLGNILGSWINWWLGRQIDRFHDKAWFPIKPEKLALAKARFHRYGEWSLLLSWVPIIGDPLTLAAGVLGMPYQRFLVYVTIAKTLRYCAVTFITLGIV